MRLHAAVFWTAAGILSASWTEYGQERSLLGQGRQERIEWLAWGLLAIGSQVKLFLRPKSEEIEPSEKEPEEDTTSLGVGKWTVVAVALANTIARSFFIRYELSWVLVSQDVSALVVAVANPDPNEIAPSHNFDLRRQPHP